MCNKRRKSKHIHIRFFAELNDLLPSSKRGKPIQIEIGDHPTVKDVIERCGIPHTEVDLITIRGESMDFSYTVQDGDRINVYPVFETIDITPLLRLRPEPLGHPQFVLDVHLGTLARYLRLIGFDAVFRIDADDAELARISDTEHRILLTRDRGLLKRNQVTRGYCIRHDDPREQIREVIYRFDLRSRARPFSRCLECNGKLHPVRKDSVRNLVPPKVYEYQRSFSKCESCKRIFWPGTHYRYLQKFLEDWL